MNEKTDAAIPADDSLGRLHEDVDATVEVLRERRPGPDEAARLEQVFKALANEHRVRALVALRDGELCACELQVVLDAPQSTVATHLGRLREAGLVRTRKKGRWTYYRLADPLVEELLDLALAVQEGH